MSSKKKTVVFLILFTLTILTRFWKINWGDGFFFHPDENNMAFSVSQMSLDDLNPHFFAYGQFPLFLTFFTTPKHDFSTIIITLRFWSAVFSCFSVFFFFKIAKQFFPKDIPAFLSTLLFIFTPGLIQIAHFGTTESILVLIFLINIYSSIKLFDKPKLKFLILAAISSGIGLATKISAAILIIPLFLSLFFVFQKEAKFLKSILRLFVFSSLTLIIFFIFSPFNFLDFDSFRSSMNYEIDVATGKQLVFYTRQFLETTPYIFQFQKVFPYTNGLFILLLSLPGLFCLPKKNKKLFLVLVPSLFFFLYQGQLFTKWTRFMAPIFFVFPFLSLFIITKIKSYHLKKVLVLLAILPGIFFLKTYLDPDIRAQASDWIVQNISSESQILSESGNVVNLPVNGGYQVNNFDFYNLDVDFAQKKNLNELARNSQYIFIPSRRVFKNQNNDSFPYSKEYYQQLFSGSLGFSQIKHFSKNNSLFLDSENAEETWSVFDNPTIRIFKKNEK